jgi:hypothetical protein
MHHRHALSGFVAALLGVPLAAAASVVLSSTWTPDPALLDLLEYEVQKSEFSIRPPRGYQLFEQPGPGAMAYGWQGARRPDGTSPSLKVVVAEVPPSAEPSGLEGLLRSVLDGIARRRTNWEQSPPERGRIGSLDFIRASWSGMEPTLQIKVHGFAYVTVDGSTVIEISSQDAEPHHEEALKLAEAAALTFQRR